ncbi:MAG: acyltransferase domain-containing protein, partial [bacterium]|nr:acyltransferase domain-containing protein [bacterium]
IEETPPGSMLSVPLTAPELKPLLNKEIAIAIDNGPSCVVAGSHEAVEAFETQVQQKKLLCMRVPSSRALHSPMMASAAREFEKIAATLTLNKPKIPYIANVTGDWIRTKQAAEPGYWATHLQQTVQYAGGIEKLLEKGNLIFIEVGPGNDLSSLMARYWDNYPQQPVINLIRHPNKNVPDVYFLLHKIGTLWLHGTAPNWNTFYE